MGSRVRGRLKREGTYVRILMADSHCCGTQRYKVTIFQLKKKNSSQLINRHYLNFKKKKGGVHRPETSPSGNHWKRQNLGSHL